jgi:hypothetical protein
MNDHEYQALKDSLKEFGFVEPLVANKDNQVIGGHQRLRAAIELEMKQVPVVYVDLPPDKEKLLNLALNRIKGRWDVTKLEPLMFEMKELPVNENKLTGFEPWEQNLYNAGPNSAPVIDNGVTPAPQRWDIFVTFTNPEDLETLSTYLTGREGLHVIDGQTVMAKLEL